MGVGLVLAAVLGVGPPGFPLAEASKAVLYTARPTTFSDGATGFATCAGVVVDEARRLGVVPLQCLGEAAAVRCKPASQVPQRRQLGSADLRGWEDECAVLRRVPELGLAVLSIPRSFAVAARPRVGTPPQVGDELYWVGFPEQIPGFLARGLVGASLSRLRIDGLPAAFRAPVLLVAGPSSEASAGAAVFTPSGEWAGVVLADAYFIDGAAVVPASAIVEEVLGEAPEEAPPQVRAEPPAPGRRRGRGSAPGS